MNTEVEMEQLANAWVEGMQAGDKLLLEPVFSPDFTLWHNTTGAETSRAAAFEILEAFKQIPDLKYTDIRRHFWSDGFVSQHVVTGTRDGTSFRFPACVVATVRQGQICRLEEWFDSAVDPRN